MRSFTELLMQMNQWYWFGFAIILIIFEMLLGVNFFLLWFAVSAASVGVIKLLYAPLTWDLQLIIFFVEAITCLVVWNLHLKRN